MPLIKRTILVEGPGGEAQVKEYYEREKPPNPYGDRATGRMSERNRKVRQLMATRVSRDPRQYLYSMGYNHCSGYYSSGRNFCPFSGSSLNRDKTLRDDQFKKEELAPDERASVRMAIKITKEYIYVRRQVPPIEVSDCSSRQSKETVRRFRDWLRRTDYRTADGISLPIYQLSPRSRGKIKDKATAFFRACPGERVFCTLTFIAAVDDQTGVAILNKFLTSLRKEFTTLQYLWVAERQTKNIDYPNNIHFHIIMNKRISIRRYNALWVMQQYNAGLRGQNKYGEQVIKSKVEQAYRDGSVHKLFNPVDVKRVRSIAGLSAYLTKYITKQQDSFFACSPWHCSRGVSKLFTKAVVGRSAFSYLMGLNNCRVDKSTGECFMPAMVRPKGVGAQFCIIVYVNRKDAPLRYLAELEVINKWLIKGLQVSSGFLDTLTDEKYRMIHREN
jgi:hypothetical protein